MAIVLSGTNNDITLNGVSVATDAEVSSAVAPKQNTLVSGTNIKTINGSSILGSGNIVLGTLSDAGSSFTANGYQKLSNGLILQWGSVVVTASTVVNVTFPISFPNSCLAIFQSNSGKTQSPTSGRQDFASTTFSWTANGFSVAQYNAVSATAYQVWFAIGY